MFSKLSASAAKLSLPAILMCAVCAAPVHAQGTQGGSRITSDAGSFLAGRHAENIGEALDALAFYRAAIQSDTFATGSVYARMYVLALTEGRIDEAYRWLLEAEKSDVKAPLETLVRALHALKHQDYKTARELMAREESGVGKMMAPPLRAWAFVGEGNYKDAMTALEPFKSNPALEIFYDLHAGVISELSGDADQAEAHFLTLKKNTGATVRLVELLGGLYERMGEKDKALALYREFAVTGEGQVILGAAERRLQSGAAPVALSINTPQKGAAEALFGLASLMESQNSWENAKVMAHLALDLNPEFPSARMIVAAALEQDHRFEDANAIYAKVPVTSPLSWNARMHLADNYDRMGETKRSIRLFERLAAERKDSPNPLIALADLLRRHERFAEAAKVYTRALLRITDLRAGHWVLYYSRGIAYEQSKQWPEAEADFLKALELSPEQALTLNYLGYSWIDQGKHLDRSLAMIRKAVELRPRDGYIVDSLGWGLYRTGDFPGAVKSLERAVMLLPADPVVNDHLGDALWRVGRTREARFQWERALQMEPDADLAAAIQLKLKDGLAASNAK